MKHLRPIAALVLLVLTGLPLLTIGLLEGLQLHAQHRAKERLEEDKAHRISLPLSEVVWEKKGKELRIGRELFDVREAHVENGRLVATGLYDREEMAIENLLAAQGGKPSLLTRLFLFMQLLLVFGLVAAWLPPTHSYLSYQPYPIPFLREGWVPILLPPPRFSFTNSY